MSHPADRLARDGPSRPRRSSVPALRETWNSSTDQETDAAKIRRIAGELFEIAEGDGKFVGPARAALEALSSALAPNPTRDSSTAAPTHEEEIQTFVEAAAKAGTTLSAESIEEIYQSMLQWPGLDASKALKMMTYALPHAPRGHLFSDAKALAQAIEDIEQAEGPLMAAECHDALRVLLRGWRGPRRKAVRYPVLPLIHSSIPRILPSRSASKRTLVPLA